MDHDAPAFVGVDPGFCGRFGAENAAEIAHLQFRIAVAVGEGAKVADNSLLRSIVGFLGLRDDADDVDHCRDRRPIASAAAMKPLDKDSPVASDE